MLRKVNKRNGKCVSCSREQNKSEFLKKTVNGMEIYTCTKCGYKNAPSIFFDYKEVKCEKLIRCIDRVG